MLRRNFTADRPDEKWVSDITYIKIEKGFVYLAVIMDLFSRKIIGWSLEYQALLLNEGIRPSMSRKGNCWDNAAMESFFARFKVEFLYAEEVNTKQEAYSTVFEYIELFYNSHRRHSSLGYPSPNAYENEYAQMCA